MAGKQKGSSSRSLSSDNELILRDSNISDKIDALSNKFDSKFDELDSKFSSLHNEFSSSNVRMQASETQGTALAADLNAVKADQQRYFCNPTFTYDGTPLELVTHFKYLGFTLTRDGSMHTAAEKMADNLRLAIARVYRTGSLLVQMHHKILEQFTLFKQPSS